MAYLFEPRNSSFEITIDSFNNLLNFWKGDGNQQKGIALKSIKEMLNQSPVLSILTEIIWLFVESNVFAVCRWRCLLFIISTTQTHETSEMGQNILGHTNSKAFKKREKKNSSSTNGWLLMRQNVASLYEMEKTLQISQVTS